MSIDNKYSRFLEVIAVISVLMLLFVSSGCTTTEEDSGNRGVYLNYYATGLSEHIDPALEEGDSGKQLINALYEGLVRLKPDGTLEKAMAEDWTIDEEGKTYTFIIREAQWSDGSAVTAYDFVYAWKRALSPDTESPYAYMLYDIKNAKAYHHFEDSAAESEGMEIGVTALDDNTLVVELEQANSAFIKKLLHPVFFPLPSLLMQEKGTEGLNLNGIVTNGPFSIVSFDNKKGCELEKNDLYWDHDSVMLKGMFWKMSEGDPQDIWGMFEKGQIDLCVDVPQGGLSERLETGEVRTSPLLANYSYQFNLTKQPFDDIRVRQALSLALDRREMTEELLQGGQSPSQGLVPRGTVDQYPGADFRLAGGNLLFGYDAEKARALLAEAGYPQGEGFLEIEILTDEQPEHQYVAEYLQKQWENELGIKSVITALSWQKRAVKVDRREYDFALSSWSADCYDASGFLKRFMSRSALNGTGWRNHKYDELLKEAQSSNDEEVRLLAFHKAEEIIMKEMPVLPLFDYTRAYAVKDHVLGLYLPPVGAGVEFKWVYFE